MIKRLIILCSALLALQASAEVSVEALLSRRSIYSGESVNLTVEVNGADRNTSTPRFTMPDTKVSFLGSQSNSRSSISIINNRITREVFEGRTFVFELTPQKPGRVSTGPITVEVGGRTYTADPVSFDVAGIEKQNRVIVKVTASSTTVLVEEPFTITLSIAVRDLPERWADDNEPIHPQNMPHLAADFLELNRDANPALKGPDLNKLLSGLADSSGRQPSFSINNYQSRNMGFGNNPFDSFFNGGDPFQPRPIRFRLPVARKTIDDNPYRVYSLSLDYAPNKEGQYTFGPVTFKGPVMTDVENRRAMFKDVYTIGPAVTVRVVPPPEADRPECFIGSIGKSMKASATFDTTVCKVGDPLSLTLEVTGPVSLANMRTPILSLQPDLIKDFRIYDDSAKAETLAEGKRFTYRVRPTRAGTLEFPAVKLAYYNSAKHAYETISTAPIPIQARATTQIATVENKNANGTFSDSLTAGEKPQPPAGLFWNALPPTNARLLPPAKIGLPLLLTAPLLWLLVLLAPTFAALVKRLRAHDRTSGALRRGSSALRRAKSPAEASAAVRTALAEHFGLASGTAMTSTEAYSLLLGKGTDAATAAAIRDSLQSLDEQMYRPDAAKNFRATVAALRAALPKLALAVLALFLTLPGTARAGNDASTATRDFLWEEANTRAATASEPEQFAKAAAIYERLIDSGVRDGQLFENLGSVYVLANNPIRAREAFGRAEHYLGSTPETKQGILASLARQTGRPQDALPWSHTAFFWHYALPCETRALIALGTWSLAWLGAFLRLLIRRYHGTRSRIRSLIGVVTAASGFAALVFALSVLITLAQEFFVK